MRLLAFLAALLLAFPAHAGTLYAKPDTLKAVLAAAKSGDRIILARGSYGDVVVPVRDHAEPVEIEASAARARSLTFRSTAGWNWFGGVIDAPPVPDIRPYPPGTIFRNVSIENARRIELVGTTLTGGRLGVAVTNGSSDIVLRGNIATGLQSDGFNIVTAKRVSLIGNTCRAFRPIPAIYDAAGKMVKDGTHPDCIQMWSEAGQEPTSDIDIIGNRADGLTQGIAHYWHPQMGRDKVYRVRAWRNEVVVDGFFGGILLDGVAGADVRSNVVSTAPGARALSRPQLTVRGRLSTDADAVRCGNEVEGEKPDALC